MGNRNNITIDRFLPLDTTRNRASLSFGRLMKNDNYIYLSNGGLEERGGGSDLSDGPASSLAYGFANYKNNEGSEFLIMAQGTSIYYYNSGWVSSGVTVTANQRTRFEQAGYGSNRNMYGVNGSDSVIKITTTGGVPASSFVSSTPTDSRFVKLHKNRLFAANDRDSLYFTDVNAFETWQVGTNDIQIAPGVDGYIRGLEIWGDSLFIFKQKGIYIIPNAADAAADWSVLKVDAETGTNSPDTICRTKDGVYYLSTDARVRRINPNVTFTSGEYVLGGTGSPVISESIQESMDTFIEKSNIEEAHAKYFYDLYIISYNSTAASGNEKDVCFAADTTKFEVLESSSVKQPYWTSFTNFEFDYYAVQSVGGTDTLYCVDKNAKTMSRLDRGVHNDSGAAIESVMELAWTAIPGRDGMPNPGIYRAYHPVFVYVELENWNLEVELATYKMGDFVPEEVSGRSYTVNGSTSSSIVGTAVVGTDTVSSVGIKSQKFRTNLRGNFFAVQCKNLNADEFTRINKMVVYYTNIHGE